MSRFFSSLFDVRTGEWPRLILLYGLGCLFLIGMTWGETIAEALFLQKFIVFLPYMFIADAFLSIATIAVYTAFVDRVAHDRLVIAILVISMVAILIGRILMGMGDVAIAYPLLYLLSHIVRDLFVLHWWTFVISLYDTRAAKRITPLLSTAARPAGAIAGLSMPLLNAFLAPQNIIMLWAIVVGMVAAGVALMPRILHEARQPAPVGNAAHTSYVRNVREGARFVTESPFLRWMAVSTFLMIVLFAFTNYQTSQILVDRLGSVKAMSEFTGALTGITNLIMLPIQLFVLGRVITRFGLGNANLIFPVGTLAISGSLIALPASLFTAGLAYFNRTTFRTAFRNTVDNLLYNAVPLRVKGRARAFISGLVVPIGSLVGGIILLGLPTLPNLPWLLPALIAIAAIGYLLTAFIIRRQYTRALITMLEQEDFSFLLDASSEITTPDTATLHWLKNKLEESTTPEMTVFMAKLLADVGGKDVVPMLAQIARTGSPQVRAAIIDTLVASDIRSDDLGKLLTESLADPDDHVRQAAIAGLKQGANQNSEQFLALALELSRDPSKEVRVQVLSPLVRSGDMYYVAGAVQALTPLLTDPDPRWRSSAVQILGEADDPRFIKTLLEFLSDPDDEVRLEAATAVERLSEISIPKSLTVPLQEKARGLLSDPVERIRQAALAILGRINTAETQGILMSFLTDPSPVIRDAAVNALVRIGKPIIPALNGGLESADHQRQRMCAVVICRVDRERSVELIRSYVQSNLLAIYGNNVRLNALSDCASFRSIRILQSVLRERNQQLLGEIFYLMAALHDPKAVRLIGESLASDDARKRANGLEAIETLTSPHISRLIAPLFDRDLPPDKLVATSKELSGIKSSTSEIVRQLATDPADSWLRAIMVFALGEIGTSVFEEARNRSPEVIPGEAVPPAKAVDPDQLDLSDLSQLRNRRSKSTLDLLGAITGEVKLERDKLPSSGETVLRTEKSPTTPDSTTPATGAIPALSNCQSLFTKDQIEKIIRAADGSPADDVRLAARSANRLVSGLSISDMFQREGEIMLSAIEKIIFLKEVSFFEGMTIDQLKILATVCEEQVFNEDTVIFNEGEPGGTLYVVVRGRVGIEREGGARKGSTLRIGTVQAYSYFGEMTLFDNSPRTEKAVAIQDTLTLRLRREPLIALTRQYPDLSLKLINVLSQRLREANDRIAQLTTAKPRELHKVFDKLG